MPKVGSSLVDIPVTVKRESVCITVGFRKGQRMSVVVARSPSVPRRRRGDRDEENVGSAHAGADGRAPGPAGELARLEASARPRGWRFHRYSGPGTAQELEGPKPRPPLARARRDSRRSIRTG